MRVEKCGFVPSSLSHCGVTDEGCDVLGSALRSNLRELDLSNNDKLGDSGVKLLSTLLEHPNGKVEKLV